MAQTATVLSTEQSLYIADHELVIDANSRKTIAKVDTSTFFNQPAVFTFGNRSRLSVEVSTPFASYFSLIRGLIEFNRPKELSFTFHRDTLSFETDIDAGHRERLDGLLARVNDELLREIRFKQKLKEVIRFEARYKAKQARVYATFL